MKKAFAAFLSASAALAAAAGPVPSKAQLSALEKGVISIVHFGLNTFTGREWGYGDTPPSVFNPANADPKQWAAAAKAGGIRRMILVCKHHDGFCLWPSRFNGDYTVANSPWKGGQGDLVRETRNAAIAAGIEFGAYLSPWDRHRADYATPAYTEYFHRQWAELMDGYGPIAEIWLDGANGGDGWYGGAKETRKIPAAHIYYDHPRLLAALRAKCPGAAVFGVNCDLTLRWPGNEKGIVPEKWDHVRNGVFQPPEADTPLRGKWFWHPNDRPKSLETLVECYFASVGRGGILNLGLAPDRTGRLAREDVERLKEFGDWTAAFNARDFAAGVRPEISRKGKKTVFRWTLPRPAVFDAVDFREDLAHGLNVTAWELSADGRPLASGAQAGYRRIVRLKESVRARVVEIAAETDGNPARLSLSLRSVPPLRGGSAKAPPPRKTREIRYTDRSGARRDLLEADFGPGGKRVSGFTFSPAPAGRDLPKGWEAEIVPPGGGAPKKFSGEFSNIKANPIPQETDFPAPVEAEKIKLRAVPFHGEKAAFPRGSVKFQ